MGNIVPPPPPQRQHSSSGPGSGQTNPQQQWQQQQQGQGGQTTPLQIQQSANRTKPWAGQDFSQDHFPVPEDKFMAYLASMLNAPNLTPPLVQNKMVDLYVLFKLVHKNGGSVKVSPRFIVVTTRILVLTRFLSSRATSRCGPRLLVSLDSAKLPNLVLQLDRQPTLQSRSHRYMPSTSHDSKTCSIRTNMRNGSRSPGLNRIRHLPTLYYLQMLNSNRCHNNSSNSRRSRINSSKLLLVARTE